jgi:ligand-binding SRPBCC domain-containing protein
LKTYSLCKELWVPSPIETVEILKWDPPVCFVDAQVTGPYKKWIHTHSFVSRDGGTVIRDEVEYSMGAGWFGILVNRFLVRPDLERIFRFRHEKLTSRYGLRLPLG